MQPITKIEIAGVLGVARTIERLRLIEFEPDRQGRFSDACLMAEFVRRGILWRKALNDFSTGPFGDLAYAVASDVRASPEILAQAEQIINAKNPPPPDRWHFEQMDCCLHWLTLQDSGRVPELNLPEPFEPMMRLLERGQTYWTENNRIELDIPMSIFVALPLTLLEERLPHLSPLLDLSEPALDKIDREHAEGINRLAGYMLLSKTQ